MGGEGWRDKGNKGKEEWGGPVEDCPGLKTLPKYVLEKHFPNVLGGAVRAAPGTC